MEDSVRKELLCILNIIAVINNAYNLAINTVEALEEQEEQMGCLMKRVLGIVGIPDESDDFCHDFLTDYWMECGKDPEKFMVYCEKIAKECKEAA